MNKRSTHKIISLCTAVFLLLPILVQFVHTLENHEHRVCESNDYQHIHDQELDCSFVHVLADLNAVFTPFTSTKTSITLPTSIPLFIASSKKSATISYTPSRGPPKPILI